MISKYLRLVKFSHSVFALPFALIGFFLAQRNTDLFFSSELVRLLILVVLCMVFARNAAMGFNRWLDRHIDQRNPRTLSREIPAGIVRENSALIFVIINSALFVGVSFFINNLVLLLSPVALSVVLGYSYTKRFTWMCHIILGVGLALAPIGAYLAVVGHFDVLPLVFSGCVLFWTAGFDIIYALQDEEFDKQQNLNSIPVKIGKKRALQISSAFHLIAVLCVIVAGIIGKPFFDIWYWIGASLFVGSLIYQHTIVKPHDLSRVNLAFGTTNGFASLVFGFFTIISILI
jgi:4-hydroxybenzoate polyprenyltransferase